MTKQTPRQRRRHKIKATILQAAREIINEKGLDGLSLRELARRIDYSPSGLYEYFKSKDDLMTAISAEGLELLQNYLNRVSTDLPPSERLLEMGLAYLDFAHDQPEHFLLIFNNLASRTSINESVNSPLPYSILLQTIQTATEAEEFIPGQSHNLEEIAYSLWSLVHGMAMLRQTYLRHCQVDFDVLHRRMLQLFAEGFKTKKLLAQ